MIPKRIFYCWFGKGEKSELNKKCIASWHKNCPDYEIIEINEDNFDYNAYEYSRVAYEKKNWAFVSDIARIEVLKEHSGFYLDTDVELFKSLDELRQYNAIAHETGVACYGSGVLGCDKFPSVYEEAYSRLEIGKAFYVLFNQVAYEKYNLLGDSLNVYDEIAFLGAEYIAKPCDEITEKTIAIHHDENSWVNSWCGGFEQFSDFVPMRIFNPKYNREKTIELYGFEPKDKIMMLDKDTKIDISVLELGNYFYNPKVVGVKKGGIRLKRLKNKEKGKIATKELPNGCVIKYEV